MLDFQQRRREGRPSIKPTQEEIEKIRYSREDLLAVRSTTSCKVDEVGVAHKGMSVAHVCGGTTHAAFTAEPVLPAATAYWTLQHNEQERQVAQEAKSFLRSVTKTCVVKLQRHVDERQHKVEGVVVWAVPTTPILAAASPWERLMTFDEIVKDPDLCVSTVAGSSRSSSSSEGTHRHRRLLQ